MQTLLVLMLTSSFLFLKNKNTCQLTLFIYVLNDSSPFFEDNPSFFQQNFKNLIVEVIFPSY